MNFSKIAPASASVNEVSRPQDDEVSSAQQATVPVAHPPLIDTLGLAAARRATNVDVTQAATLAPPSAVLLRERAVGATAGRSTREIDLARLNDVINQSGVHLRAGRPTSALAFLQTVEQTRQAQQSFRYQARLGAMHIEVGQQSVQAPGQVTARSEGANMTPVVAWPALEHASAAHRALSAALDMWGTPELEIALLEHHRRDEMAAIHAAVKHQC